MLYYLLIGLYVLVCLVLLAVNLLQQGKGGDMASAFGGGNSQAAFGARGSATLLAKITAGAAVVFMVAAIVLAIMGQRNSGSLMSGTPAPPVSSQPATPAAPATGTPAAPAGGTVPAAPATGTAPGSSAPAAPATPAPAAPGAPTTPAK